MKHLLMLIIVAGVFGCSPVQRLHRLYTNHPELQPQPDTTIRVEYRDSIVYVDTTITVQLDPDTVYTSGEIIYVPTEKVIRIKPERLYLENTYAEAQAWIDVATLRMQLTAKDTTLLIRLDSIRKEAYYWRNAYEKITTTVPIPIQSDDRWKWIAIVLGGILVFLLVLLVVLRR